MADLIKKPFQLKPCTWGAAGLRLTSLAMAQRIKNRGQMEALIGRRHDS
jgi:hypothetical protein